MSFSITFLVTTVIAVIGIMMGAQKGFAKGLVNFVALAVTLIMFGIFVRIYNAYTEENTIGVVIALATLVVLGLVYGVIRIILKSVQSLSELPVVAVLDKLLGATIGFLAVVLIFHAVVVVSRMGYLGIVGDTIARDVEENKWLTYIADHDVIGMIDDWKNKLLS